MPFPHRTIYFGVDKQGTAPPATLRIEPQELSEHASADPRRAINEASDPQSPATGAATVSPQMP
jgi:small conductance mechanosensitive channel